MRGGRILYRAITACGKGAVEDGLDYGFSIITWEADMAKGSNV